MKTTLLFSMMALAVTTTLIAAPNVYASCKITPPGQSILPLSMSQAADIHFQEGGQEKVASCRYRPDLRNNFDNKFSKDLKLQASSSVYVLKCTLTDDETEIFFMADLKTTSCERVTVKQSKVEDSSYRFGRPVKLIESYSDQVQAGTVQTQRVSKGNR